MEFFGLYYPESFIFVNRERILQDRHPADVKLRLMPGKEKSMSCACRFFTGREKSIT
jgi:hypothetical protein